MNINKFDLVGAIGVKIKALLKEAFNVKASAYYINDSIARKIGFKGHSDFIAHGAHDPEIWLKKLLEAQVIISVMDDLFLKYNINNDLFKHYVSLQKQLKSRTEEMFNSLSDDYIGVSASNFKRELGVKLHQYDESIKTDNLNIELARKAFFDQFKMKFDRVYSVMPVSFSFHEYIDAVLKIDAKAGEDSKSFIKLILKKERELLIDNPKLNRMSFNCVTDFIDMFTALFKDTLGEAAEIDLEDENIETSLSDVKRSLSNLLFYRAIVDSIVNVRKIYFLLSNK